MYNVAVAGATGAVGREMITVLKELNFPVAKLIPLASERSEGMVLDTPYGDLKVSKLTKDSFKGVDVALFSAGSSISKEFAKHAVESKALVIDNSSAFRMDPDVPLIIPEINIADALPNKGIIANPNCSTIIMLVPLAPIHREYGIKRIVVSTYQAVSGAGQYAIDALTKETEQALKGEKVEAKTLPMRSGAVHHQIAFNLIPHIDVAMDDGFTKEEQKMIFETRKILKDDSIGVCPTTVRVPIYRSHSESITIETTKKAPVEEVRELLKNAPGVVLEDDIANFVYPMPINASGKNDVFVGRIREDKSATNSISMWVSGDQIRKGAATNAVQIAKALFA